MLKLTKARLSSLRVKALTYFNIILTYILTLL